MEDRRAHERIDGLEHIMQTHLKEHTRFEKALEANTRLTKEIRDNTSEIVEMFRGAKGVRKLVVWSWPFLLVLAALLISAVAWIKGGK